MMNLGKHLLCIVYDYLAMDANIDGLIETSEYWLSKQTFCVEYNNKQQCVYYFMNNLQHNCNNQPAAEQYFESGDGEECPCSTWRHAGKIHRDCDQPAVILTNVYQVWYQDGKRHRDGDKPAYMSSSKHIWYQHGKLHRDDDKPCFITECGLYNYKAWFKNGVRHRDKGPALIHGHSWSLQTQYWLDGMKCSETDACDNFVCDWFV